MTSKALISKPVVLGKIGSCYGVKGWLRMLSFTENIENIFNYTPWFVQQKGEWRKLEPESWRYHNRNIIFKVIGVNDRNVANLLTNREIIVDFYRLPQLETGSYYWKELIGFQVVSTSGFIFGKVACIMETGSNDVLIVKNKFKKELLIPFLAGNVVRKVLLDAQKIEVNWNSEF